MFLWLGMQQYLNYLISFSIYFPLPPGWRKSKRRRSSSGKGQSLRSPPAWLSWVQSQSPPICWQRRRMRTCCSSDVHLRHPSTYLFCASQAMSVSSHASDGSCFLCTCLWWFVLSSFGAGRYWRVSRFVTVQNQSVTALGCSQQGSKNNLNNLKRI